MESRDGYSLASYVVWKDSNTTACTAKGEGAQPGNGGTVEVIIEVDDDRAREYSGVIVAPRGPNNERIEEYRGVRTGLYVDHSLAGSQPWVKYRNPARGGSASYEWVLGTNGPPCTLKITIRRV